MARPEKEQFVAEFQEKLQSAQSAVLADYRGLDVAEVTELRAKLREAGVEYRVVKNTLCRIAAKNVGMEDLNQYFVGPTAIALGVEDPVAPAKIICDFAKDHEKLEIKAGMIEGKVVAVDGVKALADLPSREVLIAQVLAGMQAPIAGFVNVLQGNLRNFVYALNAIKEQKEA